MVSLRGQAEVYVCAVLTFIYSGRIRWEKVSLLQFCPDQIHGYTHSQQGATVQDSAQSEVGVRGLAQGHLGGDNEVEVEVEGEKTCRSCRRAAEAWRGFAFPLQQGRPFEGLCFTDDALVCTWIMLKSSKVLGGVCFSITQHGRWKQ